MLNRWLLAALAFVISAVQAWDSNALTARRGLLVVIALTLLVTPATIVLSRNIGARMGAAIASVLTLFAVRMFSEAHLPELALAGWFPAVLVLVDHLGETQKRIQKTRESGGVGKL